MLSRILILLVLAATSTPNDSPMYVSLQLKVTEPKPTSPFPGGIGFSATLTNTTNQPIRVELLKMPEGYLGGGVFYPCATQFWNPTIKTWHTIPPGNTRSKDSAGFYSYWDMKPNETIEVCREFLVKERIKGGKCARFAFTFHWDHKPDILSKPFVIPDPDNPAKHIQCPNL